MSWFLSAIGLSPKCWMPKDPDDESDYWIRDLLIEPVLEECPFYGYRKVTKQLQRQGWRINKKKIQRIMRKFTLLKKRRKSKPRTTNSNHGLPWHPNLIKDIMPSFPDHIWASDITYIRLANGTYCYLAGLIDIFTRQMRGWALRGGMSVELILEAWHDALSQHPAPVYHHGDRGSQYCAHAYIAALTRVGTKVSMSAKGESTQNPYIESFWRTLKVEEVYLNEYETMEDARNNIARFIEDVYAKKRLHSSLNYQTPEEFEEAWQKQHINVVLKNQVIPA